MCIHLQIRVQSGVIDIRTLPTTTTTTTTLRTSYKYRLRYKVCTLYRSIHTSSVHLLSYVYVAVHTIICVFRMQGCQDPNWNKRHQYRGRSIPLSSVLDPWLHADFRPVLQGSGVVALAQCFCAWHQRPLPVSGRERKTCCCCCYHQLLIISIVVARCNLSESPGER